MVEFEPPNLLLVVKKTSIYEPRSEPSLSNKDEVNRSRPLKFRIPP